MACNGNEQPAEEVGEPTPQPLPVFAAFLIYFNWLKPLVKGRGHCSFGAAPAGGEGPAAVAPARRRRPPRLLAVHLGVGSLLRFSLCGQPLHSFSWLLAINGNSTPMVSLVPIPPMAIYGFTSLGSHAPSCLASSL